jgi:hypothetical protein
MVCWERFNAERVRRGQAGHTSSTRARRPCGNRTTRTADPQVVREASIKEVPSQASD